jgi:hypothetical protein
MKVAISVPGPVHRAADRAAKRLRIPRSQLYTRAVEEYLKRQARPDITERLDLVYGDKRNGPDRAVLEQGLETLRSVEWED